MALPLRPLALALLLLAACSDTPAIPGPGTPTPDAGGPPEPAAPIALVLAPAPPDEGLRADAQGALTAVGEVQRYLVTLEGARVLYFQLSTAAQGAASGLRLGYSLLRPDGSEELSEEAPAAGAGRLARARLAQPGTYTLAVRALQGAAGGSSRLTYALQVQVLEEADAPEPDAAPRTVTLAPASLPAAGSATGRLETEGDVDAFAVDVPARGEPTVLHWRLVPLGTGGRYPLLPVEPDLSVRVLSRVAPGADCRADVAVCPLAPGASAAALAAREQGCALPEPLCLQALRQQAAGFEELRNFEGVLALPPHTSTQRLLVQVLSASGRWADDRDYRLELSWEVDPDETGTPPMQTLQQDLRADAGSEPPTGQGFELRGTLLAGHGALGSEPRGVRGPSDYDAVPSDVDTFELQLPNVPAPQDLAWKLAWDVEHDADGGTPYGLAVGLTFCDGDVSAGGSGCTPVTTSSRGNPLTLRYLEAPRVPWHAPDTGAGPLLLTRQREDARLGLTTTTLTDEACACFEPRFVRGGTLRLQVSAVGRTSYAPVHYAVRTAWAPYPRSFTLGTSTVSCPAPVANTLPDGGVSWSPGCAFTREP
ncbi:hypothetical protein FGE12_12765 [Aggregicoccus sp. 17bor-14]|uniref:hypothetical protein n=1 Tax=Myxococcaceae TaxID=31 RepID=UPI00129CEABF|nr:MULTISPECIES: hypothetical protein [Myxococcaceae]MBF5043264.1 hypothetical protein [Simulacricoccus sp. 17bor-14]MRI89021.1 hypothetical protein [Aggregicoccus sp. 17bor-14]